jgi:hypothetical protein
MVKVAFLSVPSLGRGWLRFDACTEASTSHLTYGSKLAHCYCNPPAVSHFFAEQPGQAVRRGMMLLFDNLVDMLPAVGLGDGGPESRL